MVSFLDLPLELQQQIYGYAIDFTDAKPKHPWEACQADTTYLSLLQVHDRVRKGLKDTPIDSSGVDITFYVNTIPDLYDLYIAAQTDRVLRDAKFALSHIVYDKFRAKVSLLPSIQQDFEAFVLTLDGFDRAWLDRAGLYQTSDELWDMDRGDWPAFPWDCPADNHPCCEHIAEPDYMEYPVFGKNFKVTNHGFVTLWPVAPDGSRWYREDGATVLEGKLQDLSFEGWSEKGIDDARNRVEEDAVRVSTHVLSPRLCYRALQWPNW